MASEVEPIVNLYAVEDPACGRHTIWLAQHAYPTLLCWVPIKVILRLLPEAVPDLKPKLKLTQKPKLARRLLPK